MGALPAAGGSAITVLLWVSFVWAVISLSTGRYRFTLTRTDCIIAAAFSSFALAEFVTGLLGGNAFALFKGILWLVPFIAPWFMLARFRAAPNINYLELYILGAVLGCIGALAIALVQRYLFVVRAAGGAGNPAVFAQMCLCLAGIAGLAVTDSKPGRRLLAIVAMIAGLTAMMMAFVRGVALVAPVVLLISVIYAHKRWREIAFSRTGLVVLVLIAFAVALSWGIVANRILVTEREIKSLLEGAHSASLGERVRLWRAAWLAFLDSPIFGYGFQNRMPSLEPYLRGDGLPILRFTHTHNGYLTAAVDGGIISVTALLVMQLTPAFIAWRQPRNGDWGKRLAMALTVISVYALTGLSQIMFKHDIIDCNFVFMAVIVALSIPPTKSDQVKAAQYGKQLSPDLLTSRGPADSR